MMRYKFIELLNLYIDGEIRPEDVIRLEQKIAGDPQARKIYNQYCRLHRGSRLVYERIRMHAPPETVSVRRRARFPGGFPGRGWGRLSLAAGGMVAAIVIVSGSILFVQPGEDAAMLETIVMTPVLDSSPELVQALPTVIHAFSADTGGFELMPVSEEALTPPEWSRRLTLQSQFATPQIVPATFKPARWELPAGIVSPESHTEWGDYRVFRGYGAGADRASHLRPVAFQFQK